MKLKGTRLAVGMWRRRDEFDACVFGNIHDCTVECKYFNKGDPKWKEIADVNNIVLFSPNDYADFTESVLKDMFRAVQEKVYLSGKLSYSRLCDELKQKYKPEREESLNRLKFLQDQCKAYKDEIAMLKKALG